MLKEGENVWKVALADRAALVVDAENYFVHARSAMSQATKCIMMVGWDFDARIELVPGRDDIPDEKLGDFVYRLVKENPDLDIYLLRWRFGAFKVFARGTTIFTIIKWLLHPRIHLRLDGAHPYGSSHHQKIVVIDDSFAFCGGIDMTGDRWDTRDHADEDPRRRRANGVAYGPWHDATAALHGPVAKLLGDLVRLRWQRAGGRTPPPKVEKDNDCWPEELEPQFRNVQVGIARTLPAMPDWDGVHEIEALFLDQIARAKSHIFMESQYFASRAVAEAMAERLEEPGGPEIVIVNPLTAEGWLEPMAMDSARARLFQALKAVDFEDRLHLYHPYTAGGTPIYVHAKITIIDDELVRVGSANLNNRSMRLDTECDIVIDDLQDGNDDNAETICRMMCDLIGEHLGVGPDRVLEERNAAGSLIAAIEKLRVSEQVGERTLRPYNVPQLDTVEAFLADNEVLDPEGPQDMFEDFAKRQLLRGFVSRVKHRAKRGKQRLKDRRTARHERRGH
ncbi:phospholipase D-like domain-containing protein [Pacificimonas sp. ICDLI1SI03]